MHSRYVDSCDDPAVNTTIHRMDHQRTAQEPTVGRGCFRSLKAENEKTSVHYC